MAAIGSSAPPTDRAHYRRCLADSSANPAIALSDAEAWIKSGGGVPAEHCAALALVTLKRYPDAGRGWTASPAAAPRWMRNSASRCTTRRAMPGYLAGQGAKAVQSLSGALALSAGDADLFTDLARAQAMVRNWHEVVLDLNAALQLSARAAPTCWCCAPAPGAP